MSNNSLSRQLIIAALVCLIAAPECFAGRGGGGGLRGGGGGMGGGGGFHGGGGGGGFSGGGAARPAPSANRPAPARPAGGSSPQLNRPAGGGTRPNTGNVSRPSTGLGNGGSNVGTRPAGGSERPSLGGGNTRPSTGTSRPGFTQAGVGGAGQGNRPGLSNTRPNTGTKPGANSSRPALANGAGNATTLPANTRPAGRPGLGNTGNGNIGNGNVANGNHWSNSGHWNNNNWGNNVNIGNNNNINVNHWGGGYGYGYGHWGYGWNSWYNHPWGAWAATTAAVGLTSWALGSTYYSSGYASYQNPYYAPTQTVVVESPAVNYSAPISTDSAYQSTATPTSSGEKSPPAPASDAPKDQANAAYNAAADAFKAGNYSDALKGVETALAKLPSDTTLHQFRALTLFAMEKYPDAAATLYAVLSLEPGWDWTSLSSYYPSVSVYTEQLRKLETFVKANPKSAEGHFLLGYHYLCASHNKPALGQYKKVVELKPDDQVSAQLVQMLSPAAPPNEGSNEPPPEAGVGDATEEPAPNPPKSVIGNWTAPAVGGGSIALSMKDDGSFEWKFTKADKTTSFSGDYEINEDMLVLKNQQGQTMIAKVTDTGDGKFSFKIAGGPPNDPGLTFGK